MSVQELQIKLREALGTGLQQVATRDHWLRAVVAREAISAAADLLFNQIGARFLISAGTDRPDRGDLAITHIFSLDAEKIFITIETAIDPARPEIDSITPLIPGANWSEREFRDMVGVHPSGHPDPRRLVLSDDWPENVYPLRKDIPYDYKPPAETAGAYRMAAAPLNTTVVPIGPFYPVLEEPAQIRLFLDGETVVGCDYRGFYNHRGIEKLGDSMATYNEIPFIAERICGICGFIHSSCYCQAIENAASIEVPLRGRYIRSIMLELERVHSHLLWLGIAAHILGFDTVLMQTWRIREPVMWLCEQISGNRKTYGMNIIGGVRRDLPAELHPKILEVLAKIEKETLAVADAIPGDSTLMARVKGVGILTHEDARRICVTGPTARGSGVPIDSRRDHPYAAYDLIPFEVKVHEEGDILARTLVRIEETFESIKMIRTALADMPDGPILTKVTDPIPAGLEGISVVEAPRGEAIHYVITGEDNRPYRWRVRAPTYANLQALPIMIKDETIADVPITLGSMDPCFSCTERVETVQVGGGAIRTYTHEELLAMSRERSFAADKSGTPEVNQ
jgi:Ni,Fe-hydrogenase III large subunit/Ni,Fe-hydrogenase III component G